MLIAISALQPFALNVLAPALPGLARSLQTDYATIQLTLILYLLTVAVIQLIVGPISDRIGRRKMYIIGWACMLAWLYPLFLLIDTARNDKAGSLPVAIGDGAGFIHE